MWVLRRGAYGRRHDDHTFTATPILGVERHSFALFFGSYMFVFLFSGAGNGSTYRMIPSIFAELGRRTGGNPLDFKRRSAAVIGIAGAIGAFGGFLIQLAFRQASLPVVDAMAKVTKTITSKAELAAAKAQIAAAHSTWSVAALWIFLASYLILAGVTWFMYVRSSLLARRFPSLASATI